MKCEYEGEKTAKMNKIAYILVHDNSKIYFNEMPKIFLHFKIFPLEINVQLLWDLKSSAPDF